MKGSLGEIARVFLRLGLTAFGGPAAHVALMERIVVDERKWVSREELIDLFGAANLVPGPNSTELAIHLGYRRAGIPGLIVAGACFILPAAFLTLGLAWAYVRFGTLPQTAAVLAGLQPAVLGVVVAAVTRFARTLFDSCQSQQLTVTLSIVAGSCAAGLLGVHELYVLFAAGVLVAGWRALLAVPPLSVAGIGGLSIFGVFLKIGSVLYGSGYVLIAFLRTELVDARHWLTNQQLLDAIAAGQATPGPVFTTATFVGYLLGGVPGAGLATLGIFLPAFIFVAVSAPLIDRMKRSPGLAAFLRGVNLASIGLIAAVLVQLGGTALHWKPAWIIAPLCALIALRTKLDPTWLLAAGALAGLLFAH